MMHAKISRFFLISSGLLVCNYGYWLNIEISFKFSLFFPLEFWVGGYIGYT
jgi:hypothetical protein